jgi:Uma2 family endonuclease
MTLQVHRFTRADYEKLPEGYPVELIDGELVKEPSPTYGHQDIVSYVLTEVYRVVGRGRAVTSPIDLFIDEYNVLQPDVLVLEEPLGPRALRATLPLLVVEVLSPSTSFRDRQVKRRIYLDAGVAEVWLVDQETESIEVHVSGGSRSAGPGETAHSKALPGFALTPDEVFHGAR